MSRFKRIASRGWLGNALSVLTYGYFPYRDVAIGTICIGAILMTTPSASVSMAIPNTLIEFEDCEE